MRNLLPETYKKKIQKEYLMRVGITAFFIAFLSVLVGIAFLMPSYFLTQSKASIVRENTLDIEKSLEFQGQGDAGKTLVEARQRLDLLSAFDKEDTSITSIISTIVKHKPRGVSISTFSFTTASLRKLEVRGIASSRDNLLLFTQNLKEENIFDKVELPVSDLAKDKDIEFSIELSGEF